MKIDLSSLTASTDSFVNALIEENKRLRAALENVKQCEACGATMNHIGKGIFECWKCADNESRVRLFHLRKALERHGEDWQAIEQAALSQPAQAIHPASVGAFLIRSGVATICVCDHPMDVHMPSCTAARCECDVFRDCEVAVKAQLEGWEKAAQSGEYDTDEPCSDCGGRFKTLDEFMDHDCGETEQQADAQEGK